MLPGKAQQASADPLPLKAGQDQQFGDRAEIVSVRQDPQAADQTPSLVCGDIERPAQGLLCLARVILSRPDAVRQRKKGLHIQRPVIHLIFHAIPPPICFLSDNRSLCL